MEVDEKVKVALSVGEECIQEDELKTLFEKCPNIVCYDGFEPSGRMHIGQGIMRVININKLTGVGCKFKLWVADWFAQLNNKMGGDLEKIKMVGRYMVEIWKSVGLNMENVEIIWASEEINKRPDEYWSLVMDIARVNSVQRIKRCCTIMGRNEEGDNMPASQIFYPCMQAADIFFLKAHICQLGMDQRKVNMLAREYCDMRRPKIKNKPIILSHHMIKGLKKGQEKMSKSDPDSAIFMEDSEEEVKRKIKSAYCPMGKEDIENNPILEYVQYIVFGYYGKMSIGEREYENYEELRKDYEEEKIHPKDLKEALTGEINRMIEPVRRHFMENEEAKKIFEKVKSYKVTK